MVITTATTKATGHYKDASGKDLTGPQTIDGVKVYFNPGGVQVKGEFGWDVTIMTKILVLLLLINLLIVMVEPITLMKW